MFDDLRRAFREAVDNFRQELARDQVPETVDRLLKSMLDETAKAKAHLSGLEEQLQRARRETAAEAAEVETCERRERMARDIGDEETVAVAVEYAERHRKRHQVLEQKAAVLTQEVELRRAEVEEMLAKVKEARERRDELAAQAGRTGARQSLGEADDLFDELDRMAERISETERAGDAARDIGGEFDDLRVDPYAPPRRPQVDVDARLEELKRRMGREDGG